jgi:hypothetical protein
MLSTNSITASTAVDIPYTSVHASEVHRLRQLGETPSEIAAILGLSTAAVDNYLHISSSAAGSVPNAALNPALAQPASVRPGISILA